MTNVSAQFRVEQTVKQLYLIQTRCKEGHWHTLLYVPAETIYNVYECKVASLEDFIGYNDREKLQELGYEGDG